MSLTSKGCAARAALKTGMPWNRSAGIAAWYPHAPAEPGAAAAARTCRPGARRPGSAGAPAVLAPDAGTLTAATAVAAVTTVAIASRHRETRLLKIMGSPFCERQA